MNVGISKNNIPRPISDQVTGGLISGASGLLGSAVDAIAGAVNAKKQRQHDKDMAALNQQNILAQMEKQNAYQVEQWERENAYNDPKAVAERYRAAGINPRAAFGTGAASGSGVAGGLSGAPSGSSTGSSSGAMFSTNFAGLGSDIMAGVNAATNIQLTEATIGEKTASMLKELEARKAIQLDNKYAEERNKSELETQRTERVAKLASAKRDSEEAKKLNKEIEQIDVEIKRTEKQIEEIDANINSINQNIRESQSRVNVNNQRVDNMKLEADLTRAETELAKNKSITELLDAALKDAQRGKEQALIKQINSMIEMLASRTTLNKENVKYLQHQMKLNWWKYGASVAKMTSEEVRKWLIGWIPGTQQDNPTTFNSYDPTEVYPTFAD